MDKSKIQTGLVSGQPDVWFKRNHDLSTEDDDLEKCILELCQTGMIKPRQIDLYGFFSTGPQPTNPSLQTGLRSTGYLVVEKLRFSDRR